MQYKWMATWDIKSGYDQQYFEFMVREWVPGITRLGLQPREAWFTMFGQCPQILTSATTEDLQTMRDILHSPEWEQLQKRLLDFVSNYNEKVVLAAPGFQLM